MALTTFGAVMAFACETARQTGDAYRKLAEKAGSPALRQTFEGLAADEAKGLAMIEETRRLNVTEMILEPISGLSDDDYRLPGLEVASGLKDGDLLEAALAYEERDRRFFQDAADKVPLPEVSRFFKKMAKRKDKNIEIIRSLL